jgi:hypothetical protein
MVVLCRRWPEEENEMMDLVSGAEVPEAEIEVTSEMIEAGIYATNTLLDRRSYVAHIYRAMRRVELSRKAPTI